MRLLMTIWHVTCHYKKEKRLWGEIDEKRYIIYIRWNVKRQNKMIDWYKNNKMA